MKQIFAVLLVILLAAMTVQAATVNLAWDASTTAGVSYYVYHKLQGGAYTTTDRKDAGTALTLSWAGLAAGTHCFVASAYNSGGESGYSNEVCTTIVAPPNPPGNLRIVSQTASNGFMGTTFRATTSEASKAVLTVAGAKYTVNATSTLIHQKVLLFRHFAHGTPYSWTMTAPDGDIVTASYKMP